MRNITHIPAPETKNEISADEFLSAMLDRDFKQTDYFYKISGKELIKSDLYKNIWWIFDFDIDNEKDTKELESHDFIVVKNSRIPLLHTLLDDAEINFIFYQCALSGISLQECYTFNLYFIGSHIESIKFSRASCWGIYIEENSICGEILFENNSKCGKLNIAGNSQSNQINIKAYSEFDTINIENNSKSDDININNNSQNRLMYICHNSKCGEIAIVENSKSELIYIHTNSECAAINIKNASEVELISIHDGSKAGTIGFYLNSYNKHLISIIGSKCEGVMLHKGCVASVIRINENSEVKHLSLGENSQCRSIFIHSESKCEGIAIGANSFCPEIRIAGSRVNDLYMRGNTGSIHLENAHIALMWLHDCFLHNMVFKAGNKGEMYIEGGAINHLEIYQTALLRDTVFSLTNVQVHLVQLQELLVQGQLIFRNIRSAREPFAWQPSVLQDLGTNKSSGNEPCLQNENIDSEKKNRIQYYENEYREKVKELNNKFKIEERPLFRIVDCSLGKTEITGCSLEDFHFEYKDSKLLETFFSGTKLSKDRIKIYRKDSKQSLPDIAYFEQKVSIYNQLKRIFDNQGDIVEGSWYHSKAMDNQERLLKVKYKQEKGRLFGEQWFDLLTFGLNKYSNNHGESWRKALLFIFLISLSMYCLYYLSLHYNETPSLQATDRFINYYFQFLDLTHKVDFHVDKKLLWWLPVLIDFLGRILIGYGIYQFIAAFRRHGRKAG